MSSPTTIINKIKGAMYFFYVSTYSINNRSLNISFISSAAPFYKMPASNCSSTLLGNMSILISKKLAGTQQSS